ncbi:hypothetical protein N2152v2_007877 [Parachlorella kessleri]
MAKTFAGVIAILGIFSTPTVWQTFSENPTFVTPQMIVLFFCVVVLSRLLASLPAGKVFIYSALGGAGGGGVALACLYITLAANGGSWEYSPTKVAVLLVVTNVAAFLLTLLRFQQAPRKLAYTFATLVLALSACGVYRAPPGTALYVFTLWFMFYIAAAGVAATLVTTFVTPTPSGFLARRQLSTAIEGIGKILTATLELYTAPLDEYGKLVMAEGTPMEGRAIDKGLFETVWPLHQMIMQAGGAIQAAQTHISAARWEFDVYRPTRVLPVLPFATLACLARAELSSAALMLYPVETGRLRLRLCAEYAVEFKAVAHALGALCSAMSATLQNNAPFPHVLDAFGQLHQRLTELSAAVQHSCGAGVLAADGLACYTVASVLFTVYSRMRRMVGLLPAALGRDQPLAANTALVRQQLLKLLACQASPCCHHPHHHQAGAEGKRAGEQQHWDGATHGGGERGQDPQQPHDHHQPNDGQQQAQLQQLAEQQLLHRLEQHEEQMREFDQQQQQQREPGSPERDLQRSAPGRPSTWGLFKGSVLSRMSEVLVDGLKRLESGTLPRAEREALVARLVRRGVAVVKHAEPSRPSVLRRWLTWFQDKLGFTESHYKLAVQMCVAYTVVMWLAIIDPVYYTMGQRVIWAIIIVVVLAEATAGSSVMKGTLRLTGTLLGGAVGLGFLYFVVLCNGLNHDNHPQKFILTALLLALFCGGCSFLAARRLRLVYFFITSCVVTCGITLAGYTLPGVLWVFALWRLAWTAIGVLINFLVVCLVFPVTTGEVFQGQVAKALGLLASTAETTIKNALPDWQGAHDADEGSGGKGSGGSAAAAGGQPRPGSAEVPGVQLAVGRPGGHAQGSQAPPWSADQWAGEFAGMKGLAGPWGVADGAAPGGGKVPGAAPAAAGLPEEALGQVSLAEWLTLQLVKEQQQEEEEGSEGAREVEPRTPQQQSPASSSRSDGGGGGKSQGRGEPRDSPAAPAPSSLQPTGRSSSSSNGNQPPRAAAEALPPAQEASHLQSQQQHSLGAATVEVPSTPHTPAEVAGVKPLGALGTGIRTPTSPEPLEQPQQHPQQPSQHQPSQRSQAPLPRHMSPRATLVVVDSTYGLLDPADNAVTGRQPSSPAAAKRGRRRRARTPKGIFQRLRHWLWEQHAPLGELVARSNKQRLVAALGPNFLKIMEGGQKASAAISAMPPLIPSLRYEFYPWRTPHRLSLDEAHNTHRTLRQLLNILSSFASTMDAHRMQHVPLLGLFRAQVARAAEQLRECLKGMQAVVQGKLPPERAVQLVLSFESHVERLFLLLLVSELPSSHPASGQGMAFMAMLCSLAGVTRMLLLAVVRTFFGAGSEQARAVKDGLGGPASWSLDEEFAATAAGVLGVELVQPVGEDELEKEEQQLESESDSEDGGDATSAA